MNSRILKIYLKIVLPIYNILIIDISWNKLLLFNNLNYAKFYNLNIVFYL